MIMVTAMGRSCACDASESRPLSIGDLAMVPILIPDSSITASADHLSEHRWRTSRSKSETLSA